LTKAELKYYQSLNKKKTREEEGKFLIEGEHLIEEAMSSKFYSESIERIFIRNNFDNKTLLDQIQTSRIKQDVLDTKAFEKLSETKTPQGIIGVVNIPDIDENISGNLVIALDNLNDPGNLGTILRTAYWFDVSYVVLSNNSVDIHNPKVLRGSQGAVFNIPILQNIDLGEYLDKKHIEGWKIILTSLDSPNYLEDLSFSNSDKIIFVFGNEAAGISENILGDQRFKKVKIRSYSDCESLNVGISAGIVLNEYRSRVK